MSDGHARVLVRGTVMDNRFLRLTEPLDRADVPENQALARFRSQGKKLYIIEIMNILWEIVAINWLAI